MACLYTPTACLWVVRCCGLRLSHLAPCIYRLRVRRNSTRRRPHGPVLHPRSAAAAGSADTATLPCRSRDTWNQYTDSRRRRGTSDSERRPWLHTPRGSVPATDTTTCTLPYSWARPSVGQRRSDDCRADELPVRSHQHLLSKPSPNR